MSQIFISYSRTDSDFVNGLIQDLERKGFDVWVDTQDIKGGAAWRAAIAQAIRECQAFLLVLSPNSVDSRNIEQELSVASNHDRQVIPILYQPCDIPDELALPLASLQRIDFIERSNYEEALGRLVQALGGQTDTHPSQPPPPRTERPAPPRPSYASLSPASQIPRGQVDTQTRRPPRSRAKKPSPPQPSQAIPSLSPAQPAGFFPTASAPPPLIQLLPGTWQVQIGNPLMGVVATLTVEMAPNGMFQGQLLKPTGMTVVQGQWQVTPSNQLVMQGQEGDGFQVIPYLATIQFQQVTPYQLIGVSNASEQLAWQRIG